MQGFSGYLIFQNKNKMKMKIRNAYFLLKFDNGTYNHAWVSGGVCLVLWCSNTLLYE